MRFTTVIPVLALAARLVNAQSSAVSNAKSGGNQGGNQGGNANTGTSTTLNPAVIQTTDNGLADAEAGQAASLTSKNNFIDFCVGKTITNGLQTQAGSCNPIAMGDIPAKDKMISAAFVSPTNNQANVPAAPENITFSVQLQNLNAGTFTNPDNTYYAAPQQIGTNGAVIGHTHITVQDLKGDINTVTPPDPTVFAFFKGVNDDGNGNGLLSATLSGGLPPGAYRVCSMTSASNHQPVLMPVAQRGAQDDCVRFTVTAGKGGNTGKGQNGNTGNTGNTGNAGGNVAASSAVAATSAAAATTSAAAGGNAAGGKGQAGKGGQRFGQGKGGRFGRPRKFTAREFIA
ncbi:hypothetical protein BU16DRAFT_539209 [Lophium mytilinum]|uniref:Ribosomal protein s17 n=1 Tax=Lophium mytilinum TaxID=390894 RepID=A0A6A6QSX1_9PEZI|nr:hypothetical protein BU16DRAFT_539209 [Lophium mytilinum]